MTTGSDDDTIRIRRAIGAAPPRRSGRRWLVAGGAVVLLAGAAGGLVYGLVDQATAPQRVGPRRLVPPLLRTVLRGQAVCYALTRCSEQDATDPLGAPAPRERIELLAFNADDLAPRFAVDLASVPLGGLADAEIIAEQGATIWLWLGGLGAVSAVDGQVLADTAGIADLNPEIAEFLVAMPRRAFRVADALVIEGGALPRPWRIDPRDFRASPAGQAPPRPLPQIHAPAAFGQGGPTAFRVAEARLDADWLAVPGETAKLAGLHGQGRFLPATALPAGGGQMLWRGSIRRGSAAPPGWPPGLPDRWGQVDQVVSLAPINTGAPLVLAGFLTTGTEAPVTLAGPPGLLLLSATPPDGLGLARIAADGRVARQAALPMARLHSVLPGAGSLLLVGSAAGEAAANDRLVAIATTDGAVTSRAFSA